jgi:hypothetical protein
MQHSGAARDKLVNYITGLLDAGTGNGKLVFQDSSNNAVSTLTFSKPAFAASSNGTASANTITPDLNAVGGTIIKAIAQDSAGNQIFICAVSYQGGGGDIQLSSTTVAVGQQVSLNSLTYTAPP